MLKFVFFVALILIFCSDAARLRTSRMSPLPGRPSPIRPIGLCPEDCAHLPMDISFVVDASSSIDRRNFRRCLTFIEDFIKMFSVSPQGVRVSFVTFARNADANNAFGFPDYTTLEDVLDRISTTHYTAEGWTNTAAGLRYMLRHHIPEKRPDVRQIAIVITDGRSQETEQTKAAAKEVHDKGMDVFVIGVGHDVYYPELVTIAGDGRHVFEADSYETLHAIEERLLYQSCNVPTEPECEMDPVELAFVIDSSVSIGQDNFDTGMDFIQSFVDNFKVDQRHVRVAAITFDRDVNVQDAIHFDDFAEKQDVLNALKNIQWRHGNRTNTGAGIAYMRDNLMSRARNNTARVCIVLTDGESQETMKTREEAEKAQRAGIVMYAVGVGGAQNSTELVTIAGDESRVLRAGDYSKLNIIKEDLINITCTGILNSIHAYSMSQGNMYIVTTPRP